MTSSLQTHTHLETAPRSSSPQEVSAHRRHYLLCTVWSLASLTGCMRADQEVERPSAMMSDPAQPEEVEVDTPEDSNTETAPATMDPEVTDPEVTDPEITDPEITDPEVVELEMLEICAPRPVIYRNRWSIAPRLKAWVDELADETCSLESQELEPTITQLRGAARFGYRGDESCDDSGCWVTLPSTTRTWYEAPDDRRGFLDSGEVWVGVIDARRHLESGEVEAYLIASKIGHTALREIQRSWDADGHMLHDRHSFNRQLWSDVTYAWSGDLITEINFQDYVNGTSGYRFSYDYDDQGRLSATRVDAGRYEHESRWTYDAQGRPASVLRLTARDGALQPWLHQSWSYRDQGGLSTQTNIVNFELAGGAMSSQLGHGAVLDSYQPITHMSQHDWDRQAARVTTEPNGVECFMLPTGIEIGYPSDAHVYDLGWPAHMRPEGIDTLHGFQRIYRVGMLGWMSHFGVEGENSPVASYLALAQQQLQGERVEPGEAPQVIKSVISYEGLHAVSEELSAYDVDQAQVTEQAFVIEDQASPTVISQRQRTWRGDELASDRITLLDGVARTLHFTYDADGRVTERSLHRDDALIARYTWAYHPDSTNLPRVCQISRYELGYVSAAVTEFWSETFPPQGHDETLDTGRDDEEAFDMRAAYTATLGGADFGRCDQYQLTGPSGFELEVSFDERGRLTRQRGDVALSPLGGDNIEVVYHAEHSHITRISVLDAEGELSLYSHEYEFDDAGRLIAHSAIDQSADPQGESEVVHHEEFTYECR